MSPSVVLHPRSEGRWSGSRARACRAARVSLQVLALAPAGGGSGDTPLTEPLFISPGLFARLSS